jgi:hypothetical protein
MSTVNRPRVRYSQVFVLVILGALVFVMLKSLSAGFNALPGNFYQRKALVGGFNQLRYRLGDHVFPQVVVGKKGWLSFNSDGNLETYQNALMLEYRLVTIHRRLALLERDLKARGITLVVVVAPNKETIYPDKAAPQLVKLEEKSRLDLLMAAEPAAMLDLRPALLEARRERQIYYQTDTHWNAYGAYVAYREIMTRIAQDYPSLQPLELSDFQFSETAPTTLDIARLLGSDFLQEPAVAFQPNFESGAYMYRIPPTSNVSISTSRRGEGMTLLVYHDSFGDALNEFLQHDFETVYYIRGAVSDKTFESAAWVKTVQPDVIVIEIVERNLVYLDNLLAKFLRGKDTLGLQP